MVASAEVKISKNYPSGGSYKKDSESMLGSPYFGRSYEKDYSISGSILGSPYFGGFL